jgi:60 kDa SS-A/Ro ribonucleoprotein
MQATQQQLTNHAGGVTYERTLREQVLQVLSTSTLGDTFYVSREEIRKETLEVIIQARHECPAFLARALVWARSEGMMRKVPILGLVALSAGGAATKALFEQVFPHVIKTPDDLREFIRESIEGKIAGRKGLGGMTVPLVQAWLASMSEYHALKYGSVVSKGVTIRDAIRMSHPKPVSAESTEIFAWLVRGKKGLGENQNLLPQIRSYESLKVAATEEEQVRLIRDGRLPFEVVLPAIKPTKAIWSELLMHAPYTNLLRNLVTFTRHGVFQEERYVEHAVKKLTDPQAVRHSYVLPFQFFNAWKEYSKVVGFEPRIADAVRQACEISFVNIPSFGDLAVCVAPDVSGSMSSVPVSDKGTAHCIDIAGIYAGALMKRIEGRGLVLPFEQRVITDTSLSFRDDILVTAEKLASIGGGGTAVGAPIQYLLDRKISVDVFIGITDNEDWCHGKNDGYSIRGSFLSMWRSYRKEVNPNAQAFLITIAPYREAVAPRGEKGVRFIYGWSDQVLKYIALSLKQGETQVQAIEKMSLKDLGTAPSESMDAQTLV